MSATSRYLTCEGREIHITDWGAGNEELETAWHGLAQTEHDMDAIAAHLSQRYRVICPDPLGRALSQWSPKPAAEYCLAFYERLALSLLDQLAIARCRWLGASMAAPSGCAPQRARCAGACIAWCSTTSARNWPKLRSSASAALRAARRP